ncbi:MAG TPA: hypothetical protein VGL39_01095 [Jatrophihabitantaceae bacterium]|jgi:hypothetical protein
MTSVPPEPPAGSDPSASTPPIPPPATQQWSAPPPAQQSASSGGGFNPAAVDRFDWGILAAGFLAFIFSFVSYYTASFHGASGSINAWHGFFGWFAMLVALLASGLLAVHIFAPTVQLPVPVRLTVLGGYAVATLCVVLAGLIDAESVPSPYSSGRGAGYYLSLIVILAGAVLSFLRLRATGGKLPWESKA